MMKFVFENSGGRRIIKFENWQVKSHNVVWFKNCISPDLGEWF